jgi:hypothetical protein
VRPIICGEADDESDMTSSGPSNRVIDKESSSAHPATLLVGLLRLPRQFHLSLRVPTGICASVGTGFPQLRPRLDGSTVP